jgi:hypothetical protein
MSAWEAIMDRMEGYGALLTIWETRDTANSLQKGRDDKAFQSMQKYLASDKLSSAKIPEWHVGVFTGKHGPHSLAQGKDGRVLTKTASCGSRPLTTAP